MLTAISFPLHFMHPMRSYVTSCTAVLLIFLLASGQALAQSPGVIEGRVVEAGLEDPLPGANVYIEDEDTGAATATPGRR